MEAEASIFRSALVKRGSGGGPKQWKADKSLGIHPKGCPPVSGSLITVEQGGKGHIVPFSLSQPEAQNLQILGFSRCQSDMSGTAPDGFC